MTLSSPVDPKAAKALGPLPAGTSPGQGGQDRRPARQSRHARRHRLQADVALSPRIPVRSARHRRSAIWYPILYGLVLTTRPKKSGELRQDLEQGAQRVPCAPTPAPRPNSWPKRSATCPNVVVDWAMRYGNPSIASVARGLVAAGLRPHPLLPALSAICGDHHGHRQRQVVSRADEDALRAGAAHRAALLRRAGLYRSAGPFDRAASRDARLRTGGDHRLLSRHSAILFRQGRSLSLSLPEDDAPAARTARLERQEADRHFPVALRTGGMAAALYRQDGGKTRPGTA